MFPLKAILVFYKHLLIVVKLLMCCSMFTGDKSFSNIYLFVCFYYQSDAIIINAAIYSQ